MSDRAVLITGCSSGIGRCAALGLKARGWRVFAAARRPADAERLRAEGLESVVLDLRDSASIQVAVAEILDRTGGRLEGLFNNAAFGLPGAVEDLSREALRDQFETNVFGALELTNRVIPVMRRQGGGRVLYTSSVLGLVAFPYRGAYVASKFALEGLADTLRLELVGTGIHICLIEPGPILSKFRDNAHTAYRRHIRAETSPHRERYAALEARLMKEGPAAPFTLPPEAVLKRVIHALENPRPQARYYVTVPTYLFGALRRLLPTRALDAILRRAGGEGRR
ncbi:MAG: SDR family NAD(P)-dependent oxidoreductase [Candidatus Competibacter sp.]|nr:SDR family NAD(P)-dependent oxidoreductase [Candidatus Competibacter sp.]